MNKGEEQRPMPADIRYVKLVTIGGINPNAPLSEEARKQQIMLLNRCLNDYPKGIILSKDISIGSYMVGEHQLTMERITYHIGFPRKPMWDQGD
ncbi:hypothetical protein [Hominibacterium faecale]|uniref:hypothetical protein n=1 Tax=Hominibacterium faecale TaxID=2839743 RepID=UPI001D12FED3|nr:hypothetical protein [Hominibacterium faecale]MCC2865476.1 hypothetical protein [Anaerovorax odorimutans]